MQGRTNPSRQHSCCQLMWRFVGLFLLIVQEEEFGFMVLHGHLVDFSEATQQLSDL